MVAEHPHVFHVHESSGVASATAGHERDVRVGQRDKLGENALRGRRNDRVFGAFRDRRQGAVNVEQEKERTAGEPLSHRRRNRKRGCGHRLTQSPAVSAFP